MAIALLLATSIRYAGQSWETSLYQALVGSHRGGEILSGPTYLRARLASTLQSIVGVRKLKRIDLNCDMGESYGAWKMGADAEVMPFISSANIACGFHGGDPATIRKTVALAEIGRASCRERV